MIVGTLTEPFLDRDNLREIALVLLERLAGPLMRRRGLRADRGIAPVVAGLVAEQVQRQCI